MSDLLRRLPSDDDLPRGLSLVREAALSIEDVAAEADDQAAYRARLNRWNYRGGAVREYRRPNPGISDYFSEVLGFETQVLVFESAAFAREAVKYQREVVNQRPDWTLHPVDVDQIADAASALEGTAMIDGVEVSVAVVWVVDGQFVQRFVGITGQRDPLDVTVRIAAGALA